MPNVGRIAQDLFTGVCFNKFGNMTREKKIDTVIKTLAVVAAIGILGIVVGALVHPIIPLVPFLVVVGGTSAFAYLTSNYDAAGMVKDHLKNGAKEGLGEVKDAFHKVFE